MLPELDDNGVLSDCLINQILDGFEISGQKYDHLVAFLQLIANCVEVGLKKCICWRQLLHVKCLEAES